LLFLSLIFLSLIMLNKCDTHSCIGKSEGFECGMMRTCVNSKCVHKGILPLKSYDIVFFCFMAVTSIISVLSGIGGGILYSSLLVYFENFTIKESVPISLGIVLMQNSIMIFYYLYKKHPVSNQNLMIFDNFFDFGSKYLYRKFIWLLPLCYFTTFASYNSICFNLIILYIFCIS